MAKNKKAKKYSSKASVTKAIKTLTHPVLKSNYSSQSSKQLLTLGPLKKPSATETAEESVTNDDRLESDGIDHSLTREPINLGVKNVRQILSCIKESTVEVKDLILNECNIIYECKICTNLFRSLANFIAHKRIYCKKHFCERMLLFDSTHFQFNEDDNCGDNEGEDEDLVTETVEACEGQARDTNEASTSSAGLGPDIVSPNPSSTNSSAENINPVEDQSVVSPKRKFIDDCIKRSDGQRQKQDETQHLEMRLTKIKGNSNAVFQNIQISSRDEKKSQQLTTEVNKKHYILNLFKEAKSLGVNESQAIKRQRIEDILPSSDITYESNDSKDESNNQLKCDICDSSFTSSKTLRVHTKTIHSSNRIVYPCPLCSLAFKQLSNATRHLIQIHKRTKTQANNLKEVLKRRAYSTNSSENSSEVEDVSEDDTEHKITLQTNTRKSCVSKYKGNSRSSHCGSENLKSSEKQSSRNTYTCAYSCGNTFDWPPAKRSHEKSCRKRLEVSTREEGQSSEQTNGSSHLTVLSRDKRNSHQNDETDWNSELQTVPNTNSSHTQTNLFLPESVKEKVKEFADLRSLRCTHCPSQDFMNLNQLLQHAVTHIGYSIYKCHGCAFQSIYENDMKHHLMKNHNMNEEMIGKHYQTLPNLTHPRLLILPIKSSKTNSSDISGQSGLSCISALSVSYYTLY